MKLSSNLSTSSLVRSIGDIFCALRSFAATLSVTDKINVFINFNQYFDREINLKLGSTQFRVPQVNALQDAYHVSTDSFTHCLTLNLHPCFKCFATRGLVVFNWFGFWTLVGRKERFIIKILNMSSSVLDTYVHF